MDLQFLRALDIREGVKWVDDQFIVFKFVVVRSLFFLVGNTDKQLVNKFTRHIRSWGVHIARTIEDYDKSWRTDDEADFVAQSFHPVASNRSKGLIANAQGLRYALHWLHHNVPNITKEHLLALEKFIAEHNIYVRDGGVVRFYELGETLSCREHVQALEELSKVIGSFVVECMCVKQCLEKAPHMASNHLFVLNQRFQQEYVPHMTELMNEIFDDDYAFEIDEFVMFAKDMEELQLFIEQYRALEDLVNSAKNKARVDFSQLHRNIRSII